MKIGILGGGQLGRMFLQTAANYPHQTKVLDPQANASCAHLCDEFVIGSFADEDAVFAFGQDCDAIGIEIEHVSAAALAKLKAMGKRIVPDPDILTIIQDKGLQKQFYAEHGIPTADFYLIDCAAALDLNRIPLPFVQKTRTGGYDGKGVQVIESEEDLQKLWDVPSIIETLCPIAKEIASILVLNDGGQAVYPPVEMVFNPILNLVDIVQMPAVLDSGAQAQIAGITAKLAAAFTAPGLFAIEMFLTEDGQVLVNETACRVHNSGHLTIEACSSSQFDQMWRLLAGEPLGSTEPHCAAAMINLIGAENASGRAVFTDMSKLLAQPQTYLHWYGKTDVRPGRKMGHITLTASDLNSLKTAVDTLQNTISLTVEAQA